MANLYESLELDRSASIDDIKKSYRKLALKWHPDKNPDDPTAAAQFMTVARAYQILSDPSQKQQYDLTGTVDDSTDLFQSPHDLFQSFFDNLTTSGFFVFDFDDSAFGDLFDGPEVKIAISTFAQMPASHDVLHGLESISRGSKIEPIIRNVSNVVEKARHPIKKSPDISISLSVSLDEIFNRITKKVSLKCTRLCPESGQYISIDIPFLVPLYNRSVRFPGQADESPNYDAQGSVIFEIVPKKHPLLSIRPPVSASQNGSSHDLELTKLISLSEAFLGCSFFFRHLSSDILKINCQRPYLRNSAMVHDLGLPKSRSSFARGNLFIIFKLVDYDSAMLSDLSRQFPPITNQPGIIYDYDGDFMTPEIE